MSRSRKSSVLSLLLVVILLVCLLPMASVAGAAPLAQGESYTVQKDDSLWLIAEKYLGTGAAYPAIMDATNKKATEDATFATIVDAGLIQPGWKLWIPAADEAATFMGTYKAYNEAPMLAEMVAAGALPSVDERLPDNPLIEDVVEEIGQYGGTLRRGFLGPADNNNHTRVVYNALVRFAPDGSEVIPHIASGWESNADFTEWTVLLRPGAKWSDGHPFTADDIMFWYNDVLLNEDLIPSLPVWMQNADGSAVKVEKLSDFSVKWTYKDPNTAFLLELANKDGADRSINVFAFLPAHYMKQFHPNYVPADELEAAVKAAGFETWAELFTSKAFPHDNADIPSMAAWVPDNSTMADPVFIIRRNPYYIGVDPAGNQLPYIDEVRFTFFADKEALNLAAVAGEFDFQSRHINMPNYPVLVENQEKGGYRVITWPTFGGSDATIIFNQTYQKDPAIGELMRTKDFRVALSYAMNRDEIKEAAFLGLGQPRQPVAAPWHPYYPGDEWAFKYTEYDPDKANELLDGIDLTEKDANGFRLLPSGEPVTLEISVVPQFGPWPDVAQLVAQDWEAVGVKTIVQIRERSLHFTMRETNDLMTELWNNDTTGFPFSGEPQTDPRSHIATTFCPLYGKWFETGGAEGIEPPAEIKKLVEITDEAKTVGMEQQAELAQELFEVWADNVWQIGTVGLTPMIQGVVVFNKDLHNVPEVAGNDWPLRTPGDTRPEQYFFAR
jgi:peptide/nickel transport system substrate-binding protein